MKREIKFRAWDNEFNKMHPPDDLGIRLDGVLLSYDNNVDGFEEVLGWSDRFELLQYTGLKDKNGKEIYEGDVLENENGTNMLVIWMNSMAAFYVVNGDWNDLLEGYHNDSKVVGNKFENPDRQEIKKTTGR